MAQSHMSETEEPRAEKKPYEVRGSEQSGIEEGQIPAAREDTAAVAAEGERLEAAEEGRGLGRRGRRGVMGEEDGRAGRGEASWDVRDCGMEKGGGGGGGGGGGRGGGRVRDR